YHPLFLGGLIAVARGIEKVTIKGAIKHRKARGKGICQRTRENQLNILFAMLRLVKCTQPTFKFITRFGSGNADGSSGAVFTEQNTLWAAQYFHALDIDKGCAG